jgi:hypothetical protein
MTTLARVNFLKQGLHVLHLDDKHVTADRIVVTSRPHTAESAAGLRHKTARGDVRANDTQSPRPPRPPNGEP